MAVTVKTRRSYRSPRRAAEAAATRQAILDAALASFGESGYGATSIGTIATAASVSPKTIYAVFRTKRALLEAVLDRAIAGDDEPIPILERPWVAALRAEPDRPRRLAVLAAQGAEILGRRAEIDEIARQAADADPRLQELVATARAQRRAGQAALLAIVMAPEPTDDTAIDTLFAIGSPEVYRTLVVDRGWSHERFADWYAATLRRLLLPPAS